MKLVIDSYAWIEYLEGTALGLKVKEFMEDNELYTISLTISEVVSRIKRKQMNADMAYSAIISNSSIVQIDSQLAKDAGLFHAEIRSKIKDFGLVDSLILCLAKKINAKVLTGDEHFRGMKEAILLV